MLGLFNEIANWNLFKSDKEKEEERRQQLMSQGMLDARQTVAENAEVLMTPEQKQMPGMFFGMGQPFSPVVDNSYPGLLKQATDNYLSIAAEPFSADQQARLLEAESKIPNPYNVVSPQAVASVYNLDSGNLQSVEAVKAAQENVATGFSLANVLPLMSYMSSAQPTPTMRITPGVATPGLQFEEEDLYEKYRRRGLL
jgi:hypothetical protein